MSSASLSSPASVPPAKPITLRRTGSTGLLAAVVVAAANAAIFFVAVQGFGISSAELDSVVPTLALSIVGALGATLVFAVIASRMPRPLRAFRFVALATLVVSFIPDFLIPGATAAGVVTLMLMHVVAAAIIVGLLTMQTHG